MIGETTVLDQTSGWGLMGEGGEPLPTQDKEEVPVGGKTIGDEAVTEEDRKEKEEEKGTKEKNCKKNFTHQRNNVQRRGEKQQRLEREEQTGSGMNALNPSFHVSSICDYKAQEPTCLNVTVRLSSRLTFSRHQVIISQKQGGNAIDFNNSSFFLICT